MIVAQAQFFSATDHRTIGDTSQRLFLEDHLLTTFGVTIVDFGPFKRQRCVKRRVERPLVLVLYQVRRTRYHLLDLWRTIIDHCQDQPIRVGMRFDLADRAENDFVARPDQMIRGRNGDVFRRNALRNADIFNCADFQPGEG